MLIEALETFVNTMKSALKPRPALRLPASEQTGVMATKRGPLGPAVNSPLYKEASTQTLALIAEPLGRQLHQQGVAQDTLGSKDTFNNKYSGHLFKTLPERFLAFAKGKIHQLSIDFKVTPKNRIQPTFDMERELERPDAEKIQLIEPKGPRGPRL